MLKSCLLILYWLGGYDVLLVANLGCVWIQLESRHCQPNKDLIGHTHIGFDLNFRGIRLFENNLVLFGLNGN